MFNRFVRIVLVLSMMGMVGCDLKGSPPQPWIPVMENTSFTYLADAVADAVKAVQEVRENITDAQAIGSEESLQVATKALLKLKFYYLPMTDVRQLIYDADRLFYLGHVDQTQFKLQEAKKILLQVAGSGEQNLEASINKLILMVDGLILNIREASSDLPETFRELGQRVNLMLLKGELVLSGE